MEYYNVFSYCNLFEDNIEELKEEELKTKLKELLYNIPSKPLIYFLAKINFELFFNPSDFTIQFEILDHWLKGIADDTKNKLKARILDLINSYQVADHNPDFIFFGKRYIIDFLNFLFENFIGTDERKLTPDEILSSFKAYLIIVHLSNLNDKKTFENKEGINLIESLQKITWPFIINQFECNKKSDHVAELIKFFACVKRFI